MNPMALPGIGTWSTWYTSLSEIGCIQCAWLSNAWRCGAPVSRPLCGPSSAWNCCYCCSELLLLLLALQWPKHSGCSGLGYVAFFLFVVVFLEKQVLHSYIILQQAAALFCVLACVLTESSSAVLQMYQHILARVFLPGDHPAAACNLSSSSADLLTSPLMVLAMRSRITLRPRSRLGSSSLFRCEKMTCTMVAWFVGNLCRGLYNCYSGYIFIWFTSIKFKRRMRSSIAYVFNNGINFIFREGFLVQQCLC